MKGIDTTFIIDLLKNDSGAIKKAKELDNETFVVTTEANVYEIISGIEEKNMESGVRDLDILLSRLTSVFVIDRKAVIKSGRLFNRLMKEGKIIDDIDCLIAGTLISNDCFTIITRNVKHFSRIKELKVETY